MKALIILITAMSFNTYAATLKYTCEAPNLSYLNRFDAEGTLEVYEDKKEGEYKVYYTSLKITATKAGNNEEAKELTLKGLTGSLIKVDSQFTKNPYYSLKLQDKSKKVLTLLNIDYPTKLSSKIRTSDGRLYKSTCKLKYLRTCAFGAAYRDVFEDQTLRVEKLGEVEKYLESFEAVVNTQKAKITLTDNSVYNMYYTFQDEVDGGNTYGVIEDSLGKVVATIEDSDIYNCKVAK